MLGTQEELMAWESQNSCGSCFMLFDVCVIGNQINRPCQLMPVRQRSASEAKGLFVSKSVFTLSASLQHQLASQVKCEENICRINVI